MLNLIHLGLCLTLFYTCFCRTVKMDADTRHEIRACIVALGGSSFAYGFAPWAWGQPATISGCVFIACATAMQITSSYFWSKSFPEAFRK